MAAWQMRAWIVQIAAVSERGNLLPLMRDNGRELWRSNRPGWVESAVAILKLPASASWSDSIRVWGKEDETYVSETTDGDRVVEAELGIDVRTFGDSAAKAVAEFLRQLGAVLIDCETGEMITADVQSIGEAIATSRAARFASDPSSYLEKLGRVPKRFDDDEDV